MKKILLSIFIMILSITISFSQLLSPTLTTTLETYAIGMNFGVGMIAPYVITIHNPNPNDDLFDVVIIDNLPPELQLFPTNSDFVATAVPNQCQLPNLITVPAGATISFKLFAEVIAPLCDMTINNCATITEGSYGEYPITSCWTTTSPNTLVVNSTVYDETCDCDGAILLGISRGIPPVSYLWSNGETTQSIYQLCNDTYSYTVTDDLGCEMYGSLSVDEGSDLYIKSWYGNDPTSCSTNDGTIDVNWLGSSSSYTAMLVAPDGTIVNSANVIGTPPLTDYTFTNVPQGLFNIVIIDNITGCSENFAGLTGDEIWVEISIANGIDFNITQTNPTCCYSFDGSISVTNVVNSYGYVFYSWSNGETTSSISNLNPGTYFVTVSDIQWCTKVKMIELTCPDIPQVEIEHTNPNCINLNSGSINFNCTNYSNWTYQVTGSSGSYSNTGSGPGPIILTGLSEDLYIISITAGNCTYAYYCQLTQLKLRFRMTIIDCSIYSAGLLELDVYGGVQPLSYYWTFNGNPYATSQSNNVIEFFPGSGTYCVTVTDALGCTATHCEMYTQASCALDVTLDAFHPTCTDPFNGELTANATCGVPPYYYFWSIYPDSSFITTIDELETNTTYSVTVKDHLGCIATDEFFLNDYDLMYITAELTDERCDLPNSGAIDLTVVSGVPPFIYNWSNGATTQDISGLDQGTYYVTVTDAANCEITGEYTIRTDIVLSYDVIGQGCDGIYNNPSVMLQNGSIDLTAIGGVTPYTYTWSNGATTEDLSGLTDGTVLNVTVSDVNGCYGYAEIKVGSDQTIELDAGWNFMSTYIEINPNNIMNSFIESDILPYVNIIKSEDPFVFRDYYNTSGPLNNYLKGEGYKIKMDQAADLKLFGSLVCPEDNEITLSIPPAPKEEWIGYLRKTSQAVDDVFSSVVNDVMIVKEDNGWIWWPAFNLYGFTTMYPDEGYNVIMANPNSIFYDANTDAFGTKYEDIGNIEQNYLKLNNTDNLRTGNSMVLGITQGAWENLPDIGDEIGVYSPEGYLIGRSIFTGGHTGIVIYGDDETTESKEAIVQGEEYKVTIWSKKTNKEYDLLIDNWLVGDEFYNKNAVSIANGLKVKTPSHNSKKDIIIETYPNPAKGITELRINSIISGHLVIDLYSINGKIVKTLTDTNIDTGTYLYKFDLNNIEPGTYFYRININKESFNEKIIIIH